MAVGRAAGQRPLIVVGTGRCGSTFLHRLLAFHEELGWLSTFNETFPRQPWLSVFSRLYAALPRDLKERRDLRDPFERIGFWESYLPGFSRREAHGPGGDRRGDDRSGPWATDGSCASTGVSAFSSRSPAGRGWRRFDRIYPTPASCSCSATRARSSLLDQGRLARRDDAPAFIR